jgi:hypothetical protein
VSDLLGQTVGSYRIQSVIGSGGMGTVYLAEHRELGRQAAIKVLRRELSPDATVVKRFLEEARAASRVSHPGIVHIYDLGTTPDGLPFIVMEHLTGESLSARLARLGTLPVDQAVDVAVQTASALEAVHAKGIVHRDLKPDNLFLTADPLLRHGFRVKVLDFGIAKLRRELTGDTMNTRSGAVLGTPVYMSPEQCRGDVEAVDHRTDVYAMGIILFQMLAGEPPFSSPIFGDLLIMHVTSTPPSVAARNPSVPKSLEAVILKALAKAANDRFPSMLDMRQALGQLGGETLLASTTSGDALAVSGGQPMGPSGTLLADDGTGRPRSRTTLSGAAGQVQSASARRRWPLAVAAVVLVGAGTIVAASRYVGQAAAPSASNPAAAAASSAAAPEAAPGAPAPPPEAIATETAVAAPPIAIGGSVPDAGVEQPANHPPRPAKRVLRRPRPQVPAEATAAPPASKPAAIKSEAW